MNLNSIPRLAKDRKSEAFCGSVMKVMFTQLVIVEMGSEHLLMSACLIVEGGY